MKLHKNQITSGANQGFGTNNMIIGGKFSQAQHSSVGSQNRGGPVPQFYSKPVRGNSPVGAKK